MDFEVKLWMTFPAKDAEEARELAKIGESAADRHASRAIQAALTERHSNLSGSVTVTAESEPEPIE